MKGISDCGGEERQNTESKWKKTSPTRPVRSSEQWLREQGLVDPGQRELAISEDYHVQGKSYIAMPILAGRLELRDKYFLMCSREKPAWAGS